MKYLLKSVVTNNRDLRTAVIFVIEERYYLFGCPDGFQRSAALQKIRFNKFCAVFLPSLHTDFYGGLPGFLLTKRETQGAAKVDLLRIVA
jgi:ribonuclease BN (tRNA processing enzyme)